jgi:hypothetical protein
VRLFIDAKVRKVDYTLDYRYEEPERIEWDFVEGNGISAADGHYLFEDLGNDRTRATYKLGLEVGIPLPGPVARRAHKSTLKGSVEDLRKEAERRAAQSAKAKAADGNRSRTREDELAEKAGIKPPPRYGAASTGPRAADTVVHPAARDSGSLAELPVKIAGRAAGLGFGVARRTVGVGLEVAGAVTGRLRGLTRDR